MPDEQKKSVNPQAFVEYVIQKLKDKDTGFRADMTRADNPNTQLQAWPQLAKFCDVEDPNQPHLALALIGACIARKQPKKNGTQGLGEALRLCKENENAEDECIERKLLRILACDNMVELVQVLRPILRFVTGQEHVALDYTQLLNDVLSFSEAVKQSDSRNRGKSNSNDACSPDEKTKLRWASQYYKQEKKGTASEFVEYVIQKLKDEDTGFRAAMTRADNPATEPQAWYVLAKFCNLDDQDDSENQYQPRLALALIGACMARERTEKNGTQGLGDALRLCKEKVNEEDDSIERKMRRILACDNTLELVQVLRPILRFAAGQERAALDYAQLLKDVLYFNEKTKLRWASQYYKRTDEEKGKEEACTSPK